MMMMMMIMIMMTTTTMTTTTTTMTMTMTMTMMMMMMMRPLSSIIFSHLLRAAYTVLPVTWYESQVNVMQYCRFFHEHYPKEYHIKNVRTTSLLVIGGLSAPNPYVEPPLDESLHFRLARTYQMNALTCLAPF